MPPVDFVDKMVFRFLDDGFGVDIKPARDGGIIFGVILPYHPFKQINRYIDDELSPSEVIEVFWDLAQSIRKLERNDIKKQLRANSGG